MNNSYKSCGVWNGGQGGSSRGQGSKKGPGVWEGVRGFRKGLEVLEGSQRASEGDGVLEGLRGGWGSGRGVGERF